MTGTLCRCGAELRALTDEAHAEGCPNRPSVRASASLPSTTPPPPKVRDLLAFVDREGLDLLVHAPRSLLQREWTVCAWDNDEPRLSAIGTSGTFELALDEALSQFSAVATLHAQEPGPPSTMPPPLPLVGGGG
jgi:hypothetical protein